MITTPDPDPTYAARLAAMQASPAYDRACTCLGVADMLNALACQYQQEAEVLMERYMITTPAINEAAHRLDRAMDNYMAVIQRAFDAESIREENLNCQLLYHAIERALAKGKTNDNE